MRDTWRKSDLSEMKMDGPLFSEIYFYPTLPERLKTKSDPILYPKYE
jgi:hypothetical protein